MTEDLHRRRETVTAAILLLSGAEEAEGTEHFSPQGEVQEQAKLWHCPRDLVAAAVYL